MFKYLQNFAAGSALSIWLLSGTHVLAQSVSIEAEYVVSIGGTIVAGVDIALQSERALYSIDVDANVTGLGQLVARGSANSRVSGQLLSERYQGESFSLETKSSQGAVNVDVQLVESNVKEFFSEPPVQPHFDQVPIERAQLRGVNDMISAFIIRSRRLDATICNRKLRIFTGVERFDLQMHFAAAENATSLRTGYQGPVVLCQITYQPISGHFANSEIVTYLKSSDRILIWYAPAGDSGTFIPYRVLIGTSFGDLSMVLTKMELS